jgi:hypothetical protein
MASKRQIAYAEEVQSLMDSYADDINIGSLRVRDMLIELNRALTVKIMAMSEDEWMRMNLMQARRDLTDLMDKFKIKYDAELLATLKKGANKGVASVIQPLQNNLDMTLLAFEPKVWKPVFMDPYMRQIWNVSSTLITGATQEVAEKIMTDITLGLAGGLSRETVINSIVGQLNGETLGFKDLNDRAWAIYRTESSRMFSQASYLQMSTAEEILPGSEKQWMHGILWGAGQEPREGHVALDGEVVPFDESFQNPVTGEWLRYPLDPLAPASECINCGCTMSLVLPADSFLRDTTMVNV